MGWIDVTLIDAPRYHFDEFLFAFRVFRGFVGPCFVLVFFLVCWSSGWLLPCASDRRLARCMSPFLVGFFCLVVVLFCLLVSAFSLALMVPPCLRLLLGPVTLSVFPHWCSVHCATLFCLAPSLGSFCLLAVLRCLCSGYWMVIRCNFSRPERWTGLCCSEQHWCSRRALCGTIWGALVQQRLLTWHSQRCPFSVWTLFLLNGRVKCPYWRLSRICLYFSTTMHCRSIRDEDTLAAPEQFGGEYVLREYVCTAHFFACRAFVSRPAVSSELLNFTFPSQREEYWLA